MDLRHHRPYSFIAVLFIIWLPLCINCVLLSLGPTPYNLDISGFDPGNYSLVVTGTSVDGETAVAPTIVFTIAEPRKSSVHSHI